MRRRFAVAFIGAILLAGNVLAGPSLDLLGEFRWRDNVENFGGFSGLEVSADGEQFWAVSDGGLMVQGQFKRAGLGVSEIAGARFFHLKSPEGKALSGVWNDAEGLAIDGQNRLYVSFEGEHRIWRYDKPGLAAVAVPGHPDFSHLQNNSSLEVLAIDNRDRLFTLPERSGVLTRPFPVYRLDKNGWTQPFGLRRQSPFLPVGGDFGSDGRFYLLERHFNGLLGFQSRIRRFEVSESGLENEEILLVTESGLHDNLEGIAVWRDDAGFIRITMISDDNYRAFQRTEIVEYRLRE